MRIILEVITLKTCIKKISNFYFNTAKLINCDQSEISFLQNSTYAWNFFLNSIILKKNENVIILDNEYGSNLIGIINKKINYKISKLKKKWPSLFR